ncbi:hypothetical protein SAMN04489752_1433 [Brevibacterium siliguriense]|uniref:Uncharacterized protein n=1 Tax=Brevibacterium siliguriense TaxID=1136497 RepID=A0A1H1R5N8_9MICO|nr:hypothetical protein SAMN04489752_1433 [Brevibacterium siliguriense]
MRAGKQAKIPHISSGTRSCDPDVGLEAKTADEQRMLTELFLPGCGEPLAGAVPTRGLLCA